MDSPGCHDAHAGRACSRVQPGGYCAPARCYCGSCPWYVPLSERPTNTPDPFTAFDAQAVKRGQRATGKQRRQARETR